MTTPDRELLWHALLALEAGEAAEIDEELLGALIREGLVDVGLTEAGFKALDAGKIPSRKRSTPKGAL